MPAVMPAMPPAIIEQERPQLGRVLMREGILTAVQLKAALVEHRRKRITLGAAAVRLGYCTEQQVQHALDVQAGGGLVRKGDKTAAALLAHKAATDSVKISLRMLQCDGSGNCGACVARGSCPVARIDSVPESAD